MNVSRWTPATFSVLIAACMAGGHVSAEGTASSTLGGTTSEPADPSGAMDDSASTGAEESGDGSSESEGSSGTEPACPLTEETSTLTDSGLSARHRHGQTFVTWTDRAQGEAGAAYRYRLYRSETPITSTADLARAELVASKIPNHSGQMFGEGFRPEFRIDPARPTAILEPGGEPLPLWSGLWVSTTQADGCAFYAVVATDLADAPVEEIEPGVNATLDPIAESTEPRRAILRWTSDEREGPYVQNTRITGARDLPLMVELHGSNASGGPVVGGEYGDYQLYFGDRTMGYQDGLPGIFTVLETHDAAPTLVMRSRDTILHPDLTPMETLWFGYVSETLYSAERLAHPFTLARLDWMIAWSMEHYRVDPTRVYVSGGSMGAWGSMVYAARRPDLFAAVYPNRPRLRQIEMRALTPGEVAGIPMPDGQSWEAHNDSVAFFRDHLDDLPFIGWNCGRYDGFATWQEQVDMVEAMTEARHGFAFAWNDGDHGSGAASAEPIFQWYPPEKFALDESYPAFSHSSIDDDPGSGDPAEGDPVGGINLGFEWTVDADTDDEWVLSLSNALAIGEMTVDVTPRRLQAFLPEPGTTVEYTTSRGAAGTLTVDDARRMTVEGVRLLPGEVTVITLTR